MKKRFMKLLLLILGVVMSMTMLTACFAANSAYDIAVKNGFIGTEAEWLLSLKGSNGINGTDGTAVLFRDEWEKAVSNGTFVGSFEEYIAQYYSSADYAAVVADCKRSVVSIRSGYGSVSSAGAGVILQGDKSKGEAYIVTNYHVLFDNTKGRMADTFNVYLSGYEPIFGQIVQTTPNIVYETLYVGNPIKGTPSNSDVTYVGGSNLLDIAVLKINSEIYRNSASVPLIDNDGDESRIFDSDNLSQGSAVLAIGNPQALGIATTAGVVSKVSETLTIQPGDAISSEGSSKSVMRVVRVDAAINGGNSGGALFSNKGQLVGVVNAKDVEAEIENIAYAIPSNVAVRLAQSIIDGKVTATAKKSATKCYVGLTTKTTASTSVYTQGLGLRTVETVAVNTVYNSNLTSIKSGDVINSVTLNSKSVVIEHGYQLSDLLFTAKKGDRLTLNLTRGGVSITPASLTIGAPFEIDKQTEYLMI